MNLFLSDIRIQIVLALVVFAVLMAAFLTYLEFRVKKKREKKKINVTKEYFIEKIQKHIRSGKNPREKLDYIDNVSKAYFHKTFKSSVSADFAELTEFFKKIKRPDVAMFCKSMFDAYYLSEEVNDALVRSLAENFTEIFRSVEIRKVKQEEHSFLDKIEGLIFSEEKELSKNKVEEFLFVKFEVARDFLAKKLKWFLGIFKFERVDVPERKWEENFKDIEKEFLVKNSAEDNVHRTMKNSLILKEREIANKKIKKLREEEKRKIFEMKKSERGGDSYLMFHS